MSTVKLHDTLKVARWEFKKNFKSPTFLVLTILIPIIMLAGGLIGYYTMHGAMNEAQQVAVIDETGDLFPLLENYLAATPVKLTLYPAQQQGDLADLVQEGRYNGYLHFNDASASSGNVLYYVKNTRDQNTIILTEGIRSAVTQYRLQQAGLSTADIQLATSPVNIHTRSLAGEEGSIAEMLVPYAVVFILVLAAMFSGQVLMYGVIKEKRNRIVEILLSSISSLDLLAGKLVGFAALGLLQVSIWVTVGLVVASRFTDLSEVSPAASDLVPAILFFVGGYLLFASLFAAMGATMKDAEGGSQTQGLVIMVPMIPLFAGQAIIMMPNALWVRIISFIPPFIPVTVLLRMAATTLPWWELAGSFAVLVLSVAIFIVIGARIFDRGILQFDRTISFKDLRQMLKRPHR